jgi:uncharacterized protein
MITTDFVPGSPCRLDLGAPDIGAATAFYGSIAVTHGCPSEPETP